MKNGILSQLTALLFAFFLFAMAKFLLSTTPVSYLVLSYCDSLDISSEGKCVIAQAHNMNSIEACDALHNYNYADLCSQIVIVYNLKDPSYCSYVGGGYRDGCYSKFAVSEKNVSYCAYMPPSIEKDYCFLEVALAQKNNHPCSMFDLDVSLITGSYYSDYNLLRSCYVNSSIRDGEICDDLTGLDRNMCLVAMADNYSDCESIDDLSLRDHCFNYLTKLDGAEGCSRIHSASLKNKCYFYFSSSEK